MLQLNIENGRVSGSYDPGLGRIIAIPGVNESRVIAQLLSSHSTGILPPMVRWVSSSRRSVIFERPPVTLPLTYTPASKGGVTQARARTITVSLPLPWTLYGIGFDHTWRPIHCYILGAYRSIQSFRDPTFLLPIPNTESDGRFCLPAGAGVTGLGPALAEAWTMIWQSPFNNDMIQALITARDLGRPTGLFADPLPLPPDGTGDFRSLFQRWATYSVAEILAWKDWAPISLSSVNHLVSRLRQLEGVDDQAATPMARLYQAIVESNLT